MNTTEWNDYIARYFGTEVVDVELSTKQYADIQGDAMRWFNDRKGLRAYFGLILSGMASYDLSGFAPPVITVLELAFPKATDIDLRAIYGDDLALPGVPWGVFPYGALQGGVYSSLVQAIAYRKTASRVISQDPDYRFDFQVDPLNPTNPPIPTLYISPGFNGPQGQAIVYYKTPMVNIAQVAVDPRLEDYVLRRSIIAAKIRLGQTRGKWETLPTARGERSMNGPELLSSAAEELKELNEDVASTNLALPFIVA